MGSHGANICNLDDYFGIYGGLSNGCYLNIHFFQAVVSFGRYLGRAGVGNINTGNVMNTWWDGSHLFFVRRYIANLE